MSLFSTNTSIFLPVPRVASDGTTATSGDTKAYKRGMLIIMEKPQESTCPFALSPYVKTRVAMTHFAVKKAEL